MAIEEARSGLVLSWPGVLGVLGDELPCGRLRGCIHTARGPRAREWDPTGARVRLA